MAAPNHHNPGRLSEKMSAPRTAVSMKFEEVFMTLTRTVEVASVRARVKRPHMIALKRRLRAKKSYLSVSDIGKSIEETVRRECRIL
jgi:hypothetical protein